VFDKTFLGRRSDDNETILHKFEVRSKRILIMSGVGGGPLEKGIQHILAEVKLKMRKNYKVYMNPINLFFFSIVCIIILKK